MKHYVPNDACLELAGSVSPQPQKQRDVDVFVATDIAAASTGMIAEFFQALNAFSEDYSYQVNIRQIAQEKPGNPIFWHGRTAIFWGDLENHWTLSPMERAWTAQVISLAPRTILVGSAVLLLAEIGRTHKKSVAVHPNFAAAAQESGLCICGRDRHLTAEGRTHSASTRLGALRLLADLASLDHGAYIADTLRAYIGLTEPEAQHKSTLATRLIQRSGADPMVLHAVDAMLAHIEDPLKIPDISRILGTSTRQLQRRFLEKTGTKLLSTYKALRLERAHELLRHTDLSQREISAATGFSSVTTLTRSFRDRYRLTPDAIRSQRFSGCL